MSFNAVTNPQKKNSVVTIASVVAPAAEEVVAPVEGAEVAPTTAEPEVVGAKGKKDAEGAPAEGAAPKDAKKEKDKDKDKK